MQTETANLNNTNQQPDTSPNVSWRYENVSRRYAIEITIQPVGEKETNLYYECGLYCRAIKNDKAIWQYRKTNTYINSKRTENPAELLALDLAATYYPIEFSTSGTGSIQEIVNLKEIQQRFENAKPTLLRDFEGDYAIKVIKDVEYAMKNIAIFKKVIEVDIWLSLFFIPITGNYDPVSLSKQILLFFPFLDFNVAQSFTCSARIAKEKTVACNIVVNVASTGRNLENNKPAGATLTAIYELDAVAYGIKNITAEINTKKGGKDYIIFFKTYLLNEGQKENDISAKKDERNRKTFWNYFGLKN